MIAFPRSALAGLALCALAFCPKAQAAPSLLGYPNPNCFTVGQTTSISPTLIPSNSVTYSVSPPLPAGLNLQTTSGVISGKPNVKSSCKSYTILRKDTSGVTLVDTIFIQVIQPGESCSPACGAPPPVDSVCNLCAGPIRSCCLKGDSAWCAEAGEKVYSFAVPVTFTPLNSSGTCQLEVTLSSGSIISYGPQTLPQGTTLVSGTFSGAVATPYCISFHCRGSGGSPSKCLSRTCTNYLASCASVSTDGGKGRSEVEDNAIRKK
jgi:hypothetical protein